jgi:hypothetical protein
MKAVIFVSSIASFLAVFIGLASADDYPVERLIERTKHLSNSHALSELETPSNPNTPKELRFDESSLGIRCGPHALFAFLRIHRRPVSWEEVLSAVPIEGDTGSSLGQLHLAADRFGVPNAVMQINPHALATIRLPAILHLEGPEPEKATVRQPDHFALLTGRIPGTTDIRGIDTATGAERVWTLRSLERLMSGYCLISDEPSPLSLPLAFNSLIAIIGAICLELGYRRVAN